MLARFKNLFSHSSDNKELINSWNENGFLVLKKFFKKDKLKALDNEINLILANRKTMAGDITIDILEGSLAGQRMRLKDAPDAAIYSVHKINDLYLESEVCRRINLNKKLCNLLEELLQDKPLVINSLCFSKGSQQPHHFDTYYMPPPVENMMAVTSICLENQSSETGPLSYYPGSHKIPPYVFSHGGIHAVAEEMEKATNYIMSEIESRCLKRETFIGSAGDVFIWHAQLYHGGLPIIDHKRTRKTLVTHYWRKGDVDESRVATIQDGGNYLVRDHQNV